jgi:hypothetical protein
MKVIPSPVWSTMRMIDAADNKLGLPVAGGLLDQSESFLSAWEAVAAAKSNLRHDAEE